MTFYFIENFRDDFKVELRSFLAGAIGSYNNSRKMKKKIGYVITHSKKSKKKSNLPTAAGEWRLRAVALVPWEFPAWHGRTK
jgi:hypothetical protein